MNIGLSYMTQIRGDENSGQLVGDAKEKDDDGTDTSEPSKRSLGGWIALTFNQLVASLITSYHKEHNTNDTHSSNMTLDGTPLGKWTGVNPVEAGVMGSGGMTITGVTLTTLRYTIINRLMIVSFFVGGTVGGTPDTYVILGVPNARTSASVIFASCTVLDNATYQSGYCFTDPTLPRQIRVIKQNQAVWTAGAIAIWGQIAFEING